jgi:hypothetical protein
MGFARRWRRREGGGLEGVWEGGDGGRPVRPDGGRTGEEGGGSRESGGRRESGDSPA